MVAPQMAASFWSAVQECLVQFHHFSRSAAAEKVTDVWRRLGNLTPTPQESIESDGLTFDDMIYHEEPWYIACYIAKNELPLESNRSAYLQVLKQNHLA
jgi:hypothetical protein